MLKIAIIIGSTRPGRAHRMAMERMAHAGALANTALAVVTELFRDWGSPLADSFNGYWLQQTTDHKTNGIAIPYSLERTVGLGAGIQIFSGYNSWIHLNGYKEVDVRNRAQGFNKTLRLSKAIPSLPPS